MNISISVSYILIALQNLHTFGSEAIYVQTYASRPYSIECTESFILHNKPMQSRSPVLPARAAGPVWSWCPLTPSLPLLS